jgi:hypothetical protein
MRARFILLIAATAFLVACGTTPPGQSKVVAEAQRTIIQAKMTMNTFVHLELEYRAQLEKISPDIHAYAEKIRANGQQWLLDGWDAIEAYRLNGDSSKLNQAIEVLRSAMSSSQHYIDAAKSKGVTPNG